MCSQNITPHVPLQPPLVEGHRDTLAQLPYHPYEVAKDPWLERPRDVSAPKAGIRAIMYPLSPGARIRCQLSAPGIEQNPSFSDTTKSPITSCQFILTWSDSEKEPIRVSFNLLYEDTVLINYSSKQNLIAIRAGSDERQILRSGFDILQLDAQSNWSLQTSDLDTFGVIISKHGLRHCCVPETLPDPGYHGPTFSARLTMAKLDCDPKNRQYECGDDAKGDATTGLEVGGLEMASDIAAYMSTLGSLASLRGAGLSVYNGQ
jgi:hypothetical protein